MLALRKFLVALLAMLHRFLVFALISIIAILWQFGDRQYLLDTLDTVNFDEQLVPAYIKTNEDKTLLEDGGLPLNDPEVAAIVKNSFPPDIVQSSYTDIVNATYDFLEGSSNELAFTIDLSENDQAYRMRIADYALKRLNGLPRCDTMPTENNPFTTSCNPIDTGNPAERARLEQAIVGSSPVIGNAALTADDIIPDDAPIDRAPEAATWLKRTPYIIGAALLMLTAIIMLLSSTKKRGFRRVLKTYLSVTSSLVLLTVVFGFLLPRLFSENPLFQTGSEDLNGLVNTIADQMSRDYSWRLFIISAPILVIGLLLWLKVGKDDSKQQMKRARKVQKQQYTEHKAHNKAAAKAPIQTSKATKRGRKPKKKSKYANVDKRGVE